MSYWLLINWWIFCSWVVSVSVCVECFIIWLVGFWVLWFWWVFCCLWLWELRLLRWLCRELGFCILLLFFCLRMWNRLFLFYIVDGSSFSGLAVSIWRISFSFFWMFNWIVVWLVIHFGLVWWVVWYWFEILVLGWFWCCERNWLSGCLGKSCL